MDFCREAGLKQPEIKETGLFIKVIFYKTSAVKTAKDGGQKKWSEMAVGNNRPFL